MTDDLANIKDEISKTHGRVLGRKPPPAATAVSEAVEGSRPNFRDSLTKKLAAIAHSDPQAHLEGFFSSDRALNKASGILRAAPLMQFMNPAEKVQQTVVADIQTDLGGFKKVETLDRCTTCHVNIANKDFTREKVQGYLEEAGWRTASRGFPLCRSRSESARRARAATSNGRLRAAAMPEFWHAWGRKLLAPESYAKTNAQLKKSMVPRP